MNEKINLEKIIEYCNKNNINFKLLRGFNVDVDSKHEFIFINKHCKLIPKDILYSLGIEKFNYESGYEINTSFDTFYLGYYVTSFDLISRKYNWKSVSEKPLTLKNSYCKIEITAEQHKKNCEASRWSDFRDSQRLIDFCNVPERSWSTESRNYNDDTIHVSNW